MIFTKYLYILHILSRTRILCIFWVDTRLGNVHVATISFVTFYYVGYTIRVKTKARK